MTCKAVARRWVVPVKLIPTSSSHMMDAPQACSTNIPSIVLPLLTEGWSQFETAVSNGKQIYERLTASISQVALVDT